MFDKIAPITTNIRISIMQTLYIEHSGGLYRSWFYSEGQTFKGKHSASLREVECWAKRNDFNKLVHVV